MKQNVFKLGKLLILVLLIPTFAYNLDKVSHNSTKDEL